MRQKWNFVFQNQSDDNKHDGIFYTLQDKEANLTEENLETKKMFPDRSCLGYQMAQLVVRIHVQTRSSEPLPRHEHTIKTLRRKTDTKKYKNFYFLFRCSSISRNFSHTLIARQR